MGLRRINVDGLDKVLSLIEELKKEGGKIFILFCGSSDPVTGHSWCSDCVKAEPVIDKVAFEAKGGVLITCTVGDRPT
jgi:thiol-disulfide isomerase/thioredoxin